ncbi:alpha/beta fold hydrolase domain-containing protein [Micromonospora siamensis]|uniref:Alpha/beta hydrolase family protein n=1 Tax=Micromonospora siamensis TaxID=299152 RepID=A0A1C5HTM0_9ACTN|nr:hypothetical protein [Micromonospora siamensis]SCG49374.1 hypothetical protein GA0074704_2336 [Micromonospora siamensis]
MRPAGTRFALLLALAALLPALEAAILAALHFRAALGLAPQLTAVRPYASYHDLRWVLVYHNSWPGFVAEFLAATALRGLLSSALVALAWPAGVDRPAGRWLVRRNLEVALLSNLVISPWAALSVAAAGVALSWYLFASLLPLIFLAPFLQRGGVVDHWWRGLPSTELVGWSLLNVVVLTLAGAVTSAGAGWWAVPVAMLAGAANGLLWQRTVRAAVLPSRVRWRRVPVTPVAFLLALLMPLAAQGVIGITAGGSGEWRPPVFSQNLPERVAHAVIALAGYDSTYDGRPAADPRVERYSYRGLDGQDRPLPYQSVDTHQSLGRSAELLSAHVDALHRRTGLPVALIGQSEGAMVARTYLELRPRSPVDTVLLFSPLVRPGRAYYPPAAATSGWGLAAGWELRGLFAATNLVRRVRDDPDEPFVRSILDNAPFYRTRMLCPVPGVVMVAFLPTVTAAEAPPGEYSGIPVFQVPAFHGGVIGRTVAQERLIEALSGERAVRLRRPEYAPLQRLAAAWQAPPLPLSVNPAWSKAPYEDPAFTGRVCRRR